MPPAIIEKNGKRTLAADIYCITSESHSNGKSNIDVVEEMIASGIQLIQYREKEKKMGEKYHQCIKIRELTRKAGVCFIVNDHVDLALMVEADGVHIGQEDLPIEAVRQLVGPGKVIGLSTHSPEQARDAVARGADYIGVGPIFQTFTKKDVCDPVGLSYLDFVTRHMDIPFVAIGGIKIHNVNQVVRHGADCVSLVTEIVGANHIGNTIKEIRAAIQNGSGDSN
jgi:thiamine-phosphate pyrophosphorylase